MKTRYQGVELSLDSAQGMLNLRCFMLAFFLVAALQPLAVAVSLEHLTGLSFIIWAPLILLLGSALEFKSGAILQLLPDVLRKNLFWLLLPVAAYGFASAEDAGLTWPTVLALGVAFRFAMLGVKWYVLQQQALRT